MSYQQYVNQLRPRNKTYISKVDKVKTIISEAFTIPVDSDEDIDKFKTDLSKNDLKKLLKHLKSLDLGDIAFAGSDLNDGKLKIRNSGTKQDEIKKWIGDNTNLKGLGFGQGTPVDKSEVGKSPPPKGADWENIITKQFNSIVGQPNFDKEANKAAEKFSDYDEMGIMLAKNIKNKIGSSPITQFGAGKSKANLSDFWTTWGAGDGTPKTDMYNKEYNISLKKKGGSQLASGAKGETLATFHAALEYMGQDRGASKDIDKILTAIENNFIKLSTKYTKGQLEKISKDQDKQKDLSKDDKAVLADFITTESFHKELNKEIQKNLTFDKQPEFLKWYTFEAMSGYKKFAIQKGKASVCLEFDADNGSVSKFIEVTKGGKSSGLKGTPSVSSDVIGISKKVKVYSAWKSGSGSPYSSLRLGLTNDYTTDEKVDSLHGIIRDEILNDKIANAVLTEEITQLDEFAIIRRTFSKLKNMGKKAITWLTNLIQKIMVRVKQVLNKIKTIGAKVFEKLFQFLGIEVKSVRESFPSDISGFVYGMSK